MLKPLVFEVLPNTALSPHSTFNVKPPRNSGPLVPSYLPVSSVWDLSLAITLSSLAMFLCCEETLGKNLEAHSFPSFNEPGPQCFFA